MNFYWYVIIAVPFNKNSESHAEKSKGLVLKDPWEGSYLGKDENVLKHADSPYVSIVSNTALIQQLLPIISMPPIHGVKFMQRFGDSVITGVPS